MRRGFKAEAERIGTEIRAELGLNSRHKLDPLELADHLAIPVIGMSQLSTSEGNPEFSQYFTYIDPDSFSAVTVFIGRRRLIVHNESHHPNRQVSNISHEISHTLLEHQPTAILNNDGQRYWDSEMEEEANWLGAALLVPREGALQMARGGQPLVEIASHFGVSEILCRWRITQTGILQQVQRANQWI